MTALTVWSTDNTAIARLEAAPGSESLLTEQQVTQIGKLIQEIMGEVYPAPLLPMGDAEIRGIQAENLTYALLFFLSEDGWVSKKAAILQGAEKAPYKAMGKMLAALRTATVNLYNVCELAGALDLLPFKSAHDHWVELVKRDFVDEFKEYRASGSKSATFERVRTVKESLEQIFPEQKRRSRTQKLDAPHWQELIDPSEATYQWLELVVHVGTHSPSESWHLRKPKKKLRDSFNEWVAAMGGWQRVLRQPKYNMQFVYSNGASLIHEGRGRKKAG